MPVINNFCEDDKPYRPSNGTEGMMFMEQHCVGCPNFIENKYGFKGCEILDKTFVYDTDDKEYPKEWVWLDHRPHCTQKGKAIRMTAADKKYLAWKEAKEHA